MTKTCGRCKGAGFIPAFAHVAGGKCLRCGGKGTINKALDAAERAAEDAATTARANAAYAAEDAERAARAARRAARAARRATEELGA